ncbi:MAG: hypothetical protein RIC56_09050 [Pseudomonadales bacterium]
MLRLPFVLPIVFLLSACAAASAASRDYALDYRARFLPDEGVAAATVRVRQRRPGLTLLDFNAPEARYRDFAGDGGIERDGDRLIWTVPAAGGELRYRVTVDHKRGGAYDSRLTEAWAITRLDELFPPVRSRSWVGAEATTTLHLEGPPGWSFETAYGPVHEGGVRVDTDGRRFDRPLGWLAAGQLGIRRTQIGERRIAIAGPRDQQFRRLDALTFLRWTLPELARVAPTLPARLLVVSGSRDMWRGALSGPASLYIHPDRPLVSGNATSTMVHELMHVATEEPPAAGDDWIVEGLAEYYSLVILLRTDGISGDRFERSMAFLRNWVKDDDGHLADPSSGANTAFAALMFRDLDLELAAAGSGLDSVTAALLAGRVDRERLASLAAERLGRPSRVLAAALAEAPRR